MCKIHAYALTVQERINSLELTKSIKHLTAEYRTYEENGFEINQVPLFNLLRNILDSMGPVEDGRHPWYEDDFRQRLQEEERCTLTQIPTEKYMNAIKYLLEEVKKEISDQPLPGRWVDGKFQVLEKDLYTEACEIIDELLEITNKITTQL
jgi:hypothetical protein